jgi:hypothetical protein
MSMTHQFLYVSYFLVLCLKDDLLECGGERHQEASQRGHGGRKEKTGLYFEFCIERLQTQSCDNPSSSFGGKARNSGNLEYREEDGAKIGRVTFFRLKFEILLFAINLETLKFIPLLSNYAFKVFELFSVALKRPMSQKNDLNHPMENYMVLGKKILSKCKLF